MSRSKWKGPYSDQKALKTRNNNKQKILLISRKSQILPKFIGLTFNIHNGKNYIELIITENMINHKFGEFSFTRANFAFKSKKKIKLMGQKTNPQIFQLGKTNNWKSKYFEKKTTEYLIYSKKDLEIKKFIQKFFKNQKIKIAVHDCKLYYLDKSLHIFISYHQVLDWLSLTITTKKYQINKKIYWIKNFLNHQKTYKTRKKIKSTTLKMQKTKIYEINKNLKMKLFIKKIFESLKIKLLIKQFFESLTKFTSKKFNIFLTLQRLNSNIKQTTKKDLIKLRKYKNNEFFQEGIKILFTCATNKKSSKLLAQFIAIQLKILKKHHNFFLRFIKNALVLLKKNIFSKFKGIKIKVKGRLNGRPRARSRIIKIANNIPVLSIKSNINYSETTAFTPNGTFGVKVWIHEFSK